MSYDQILYPEGYHWSQHALTYTVAPELAAWKPLVQRALSEWDKISGLSFTEGDGKADIAITTLGALNAPAGALGWSVITTDDESHAITHGAVGLPASPDETGFKAFYTALHEIGHTLGLSHPDQQEVANTAHQHDTVMSYQSAAWQFPQAPLAWDVEAVQALYGADRELRGGAGDDVLAGGAGDDALSSGDGDDTVLGMRGDDRLEGGNGNDQLHGGRGADTLWGGDGADELWGDPDDDVLTGGRGADVFMFAPEGGRDLITDFSADEGDRLLVSAGMTWTLDSNAAGDAVITFADEDMLTLAGIAKEQVSATWFVTG